MATTLRCLGPLVVLAGLLLPAKVTGQEPRVTNGQTVSHVVRALDADVKALAAAEREPAWIAYAVPIVDGRHSMCCGDWHDGRQCCGSCRLETGREGSSVNQQTSTVALEGGKHVHIYLRAVSGRVEKVRAYSGDCTVDAGGRTVHWLTAVRSADSVKLLEGFVSSDAARRDELADSAIMAIAMHQDASADPALERFIAPNRPKELRKKATFWMGNARGARGLSMLKQIVAEDLDPDVRKAAVFAISLSPEPDAIPTLIQAARGDAREDVRGDAIFWLAQKAGRKAADTIADAVENDPEVEVKKRAVFALSQLPKDEGVPRLIKVARTHKSPAVRKQAMFWLGQSKDPRALAFFEEILR
jgi:HEAT repeat protein